jgi:prepilin-type processing-associated H-X9-DG protein
MEQAALDSLLSSFWGQPLNPSGTAWSNPNAIYYANDPDDLDGSPSRRPDVQFQWTMRNYMRCPSGGNTDVDSKNSFLTLENLLKGNYAANFGGGMVINALPANGTVTTIPNNVNPNPALQGPFTIVKGITKFPIQQRMGFTLGTKLLAITDGTSNTVLISEVDTFDKVTGSSSSSPFGLNFDMRGAMTFPGPGSNTFYGAYPPNSFQTDSFPGCGDAANIPANSPLVCTLNTTDPTTMQAAARSRHTNGVNASFADGSVKFIQSTINPTVWTNLCTKAGNEVIGNY